MEIGSAKPAAAATAAAKREHQKYVMAQASLRLLTCMLTAAAAIVMGLNKQSSFVAGFEMKASINTDPTFKFFVIGNAIAAGYAAFSLIFLFFLNKRCIMQVMDLVALCLVVAAAASTTAIGYLGKHGNNQIGWSGVCPYYEKFCHQTAVSIALSYIGTLIFIPACTYRRSRTCSEDHEIINNMNSSNSDGI